MNRHFINIFALLALAFLTRTVVKFMPDNQQATSEANGLKEEQTKRNSDVVLFWQHYDRATELRSRGQYAEAREYYAKALEIDSTHRNSLYYLGNMQLASREFSEAEKTWKKLIEMHTRSARGYLQLGNLYSCKTDGNSLFDLSRAEQRFETAGRLNSEETGPQLQLAKIHMIKQNYDRAEEMLNDVISSNFRSVEAYFLNGYLKWRSGNKESAGSLLEKAFTIHLQSSEETSNVGEGETKAGNSPMLTNTFRCSLFSEHIIKQLESKDETDVITETVYPKFERKLSQY